LEPGSRTVPVTGPAAVGAIHWVTAPFSHPPPFSPILELWLPL
jgi:hypothetical protein